MALVACFFKASMLLRSVHTTIVNEMGWPSWISYIIFAGTTIVMGALLGLILVCCIDCIYPNQKVNISSNSQNSQDATFSELTLYKMPSSHKEQNQQKWGIMPKNQSYK